MKLINFSIFKKVSKNHDKISDCRYLPKIPFVPRSDNDPLGVNKAQNRGGSFHNYLIEQKIHPIGPNS